MKKYIAILSAILTFQAKAQFFATILQTLDTAYQAVSRIGTSNYLAALRQNALDIRQANTLNLGARIQSVNIPGLTLNGGMEVAGSFAYVMDYNLTAIDLTNPMAPAIGTVITLPAFMISHCQWGSLLYIFANNSKCYVYSLANSAIPALVDSVPANIIEMKNFGNKLFTHAPVGNKIYTWTLSNTSPYLALADSTTFTTLYSISSICISGSQLLFKNTDSLYRFRINPTSNLSLINSEKLPAYPFNGKLVARDTNVIGYARYNSFYISSGVTGNSFIDSVQIPVDGNYTLSSGVLDNNLYYSNVVHTYLIGFSGNSTSLPVHPLPNEILIFPNPTAEALSIIIERPGNYKITVRTINGDAVITQLAKEGKQIVNLAKLPAGTYVIDLYNESLTKLITRKFVKI